MFEERDRKLLETQVKDMNTRLDEAEQNALKGGKKAMSKMESRYGVDQLKKSFNNTILRTWTKICLYIINKSQTVNTKADVIYCFNAHFLSCM